MKIQLQARERQFIISAAEEFERQTGEKYSIRFVMLLLSERYEAEFEETIKNIFDEKIRAHEEERARQELAK